MLISTATAADLEPIQLILKGAGLPTSDVAPALLASFVVARGEGDAVVATGAVQRAGADGLLRSVTVLPAFRARGVGKQIMGALEARARYDGLTRLYLLTTSRTDYFSRLGYERVAREQAPEAVRITAQFIDLCPASSTLMVKVFNKG